MKDTLKQGTVRARNERGAGRQWWCQKKMKDNFQKYNKIIYFLIKCEDKQNTSGSQGELQRGFA